MTLKRISTLALTVLLTNSTLSLALNGRGLLTTVPALAQTSTDLKTEADLLLRQGIEQAQANQFRAALNSWQQALQHYQSIGDRQGEARTLGNIGIVYRSLDQYQKANLLSPKGFSDSTRSWRPPRRSQNSG